MNYLVALRTAIVAKLDADPYFAAAVPEGLTYRPKRAPVRLPSVVFWDVGTRGDNIVPLHDRTFHFDIFAADLDTAEDIAAMVTGLLDNQGITIPGGEAQVAYMNLRGDDELAMHDADVVRKMLTFRMLVYDYTGPEPFQAP